MEAGYIQVRKTDIGFRYDAILFFVLVLGKANCPLICSKDFI